jgi:PAS domain S-box-containing protein/putative nucleotidyltransferase with HDIG domain
LLMIGKNVINWRGVIIKGAGITLITLMICVLSLSITIHAIGSSYQTTASANEDQQPVSRFQATPAPRPVIRVGGDQSYPPYEFINNGMPSGFNVDLIRAVAAEMGFDVEIQLGPWNDVRQDLLDGKIDMVMGMAFSVERDKIFDFSVPYTFITFDLFVPEDSSIRTLNDVRGKTIVVQSGGVMHEYLQESDITTELSLVQNVSDALNIIDQGTYEASLLNRMQGQYLMRELALTNVRRVNIDLLPRKYSFAVVEGNKELLALLNEGLYVVNATGQLGELQEKWFGVYEQQPVWWTLRPVILGFIGILALLALSLGLTWILRRQIRIRTLDLHKSEEKYRLLVENATEGVVVSSGDSLVFANPAAAAITGYTIEELVGKRIADLVHPDDLIMVFDRYHRRLRNDDVPSHYSFRLVTRSRETRWIQVHAVVIEWEGQPATLDMFIDVTERRRAEEQIQQQLRHMAALRAVDMAITASMDLPLTLRVLLEQVTVQLGVDAASVLLYEEDSRELVYAAGQGFHTGIMKELRLRLGNGFAGEAALKRRMVRIPNLEEIKDEFWTSTRVKAEGFKAYICLPLISKGVIQGVLEIYNRSPLSTDPGWMNFLEGMANQAAIAIDNTQLLKNIKTANLDLILAYDATIAGWARALELRDGDTEGHSQRVADLAVGLAAEMGLRTETLAQIRRGAILHDIGKMAVPDSILKKDDDLSSEEWEIMRMHPKHSYEMLSPIEFLRPALDIPLSHHEWWDGSGYPRGLKGEEIPLSARIFAVVDVWDALINDRLYRKSWSRDQVFAHLQELSGKQFDPRVVEAFLRYIQSIENVPDVTKNLS